MLSKKRQNTYGTKPILLKMAQLEQIFYRDPLHQFISLRRELDVRELDALIGLAGIHPLQIKAIHLFHLHHHLDRLASRNKAYKTSVHLLQAVHVLSTLLKLFQLKLCQWIPTNQLFQ